MKRTTFVVSWILAVALAPPAFSQVGARLGANATQAPASRPAKLGIATTLDRVKAILGEMDLTDDQRSRINLVMADAQQKVDVLTRQVARGFPPAPRIQQAETIAQNLRQALAQILTPDQTQQLTQSLDLADGGSLNSPAVIDQMQRIIAQMPLTLDQRLKIQGILQTSRKRIADLRQSAVDGNDIQAASQKFRDQLRTDLATVLTPDQMRQLAQQLGAQLGQQAPAARSPLMDDPMMNGMGSTIDVPVGPRSSAKSSLPMPQPGAGPEVGDHAPDFSVTPIAGTALTLSHFAGKPLLIEFGSLSCPVFRDHAAGMEKLKSEFGNRVNFLLVYTAEAYPAGSWTVQRNVDDHIALADAVDFRGRFQLAQQAREKLHITLAMGIDSMDNKTAKTYGLFPNGSIIIDRDGVIFARQQWTNPDNLQDALDDLLNPEKTP